MKEGPKTSHEGVWLIIGGLFLIIFGTIEIADHDTSLIMISPVPLPFVEHFMFWFGVLILISGVVELMTNKKGGKK